MSTRHPASDAITALADNRIPFPPTTAPTPCQDDPALFSFEEITDPHQRAAAIAGAKAACSVCPIVTGCLKWALANPVLTRRGVWAATTPGVRAALRKGLVRRLGDDWPAAVADQDRQRAQQRRKTPPTVREQVLARLERKLFPARAQFCEPGREPLTPERRTCNLRLLERALADRAAKRRRPQSRAAR